MNGEMLSRLRQKQHLTPDPANASDLMHALWPVPEKGFRILRVVYNETVEPVAVVTAFFDAKVKTL
jgi:hypothetical protein